MLTLKFIGRHLFTIGLAMAAIMLMASLFGFEVAAQDTGSAREGLGLAGGATAGGEAELSNIISTIVDILSIIVGALSVIMIIVGGLKYVVSSGDSAGTQSAKNTILYAIVGLVIVIFAQVIVSFVISRVETGSGCTPNPAASPPVVCP